MNEERKCVAGWAYVYALGFFTPRELCRLHCGDYHDVYHTLYVMETVVDMASKLRLAPDRINFLAQVALLHDADPRESGTPADVRRTLRWIELQKAALCERFDWSEEKYNEALALICRTEYPFDRQSKKSDDVYNGLSPAELYDVILSRVEDPARLIVEGQILRFSDQVANYIRDWNTASLCQKGLIAEMRAIGLEASQESLNTPKFLADVGKDWSHDLRIAWSQGVPPRLLSRNDLLYLLSDQQRTMMDRNIVAFEKQLRRAA